MNILTPEKNVIEPPQLALSGQCAYAVEGARVVLTIEQIANNRPLDNLSGTLAVELWALAQPYTGGLFEGQPLAATMLGELRGAHVLNDCRYDLIFTPPTAGYEYFTLMLREWENGAFVTRDWQSIEVPAATETVVEAAVTEAAPVPETAAVVAPAVVKKGISINTATEAEIAAVQGVSKKIASAIVAQRPYQTLDKLKKVKGVGEKVFKKLKDKFCV